MKKKRTSQSVRGRQRISLRMVVFATTYCVLIVATGVVIFINLSHVEKSMAQATAQYTIEEERFVTDKALPTTVSKQHPLFGPETQFLRKAKQINPIETNISEQ
jgi:hypothetical protein